MTMTTAALGSATRGAEIDVGSGRPTGAREVEENRNAGDGAAELTFTEINAGSGVGHGQHNEGGRRP